MHQPLISICIPTYNRAEYLKETLESITRQNIFLETSDVEIVISDNCSSDHTSEVVNMLIKKFGQKIKYHRNDVNIHDKNMEACLRMGTGDFLKLNNDTLKHNNNSLEKSLAIVRNNLASKPVLFFINGVLKGNSSVAKNLDEFVTKVSFNSTWIGAFGIWKKDFFKIDDFDRYAKLQLTQTDVLFRTIGRNKEVYICNETLFTSLETAKKGGYDIIDVFLDNYTFILREAVANGMISQKVYSKETERLLLNFLCHWMARIQILKEKFYFTAYNGFSRIIRFYKNKPIVLLTFFSKYIVGVVFILLKKVTNSQDRNI
jgi:abequosyltransferase